jgi:hypothetical protein
MQADHNHSRKLPPPHASCKKNTTHNTKRNMQSYKDTSYAAMTDCEYKASL